MILLLRSTTLHKEADDAIRQLKAFLPNVQRILDIGSKNHNGDGVRKHFDCEIVGIDKEPGEGVDFVLGAEKFFPKENGFGFFDLVTCTEVLEHVPSLDVIFECAKRSLNGGYFFVTCASTGRPKHSYDGSELKEGEFYLNVDVETFFALQEKHGAEMVYCNYSFPPGDLYALLKF